MSKPRFANKWYQTPPVTELRQEIQNVYTTFLPAIYGAAESTDSDGNPTPNTIDFPPAKYDEGTLFFATSYPTGVDGGSMQFQLVGGAWVWRWGEFADSNSSGEYVRNANGNQRCLFIDSVTTTTSNAVGNIFASGIKTYNLPAEFVGTPKAESATTYDGTSPAVGWGAVRTTSATQITMHAFSHQSDGGVFLGYITEGRWKE
jgi:hypothetical protein